MLPFVASADPVEIDGICYNLITKAKIAEVTSNSYNYKGGIVIPETINYNNVTYSVTSIGDMAFYYCEGLTSIAIPSSVTSIGERAFGYCLGLKKVIVSDIAAWCNIDFHDNPLAYAQHLYSDENTEIMDLVIPNSVTNIGRIAFNGCSSLTSVTIPNGVISLKEGAFGGCSSLSSVTIPNSVTSIGNYVFSNCSGLSSITLPNSIASIGDDAFLFCSSLTSISIPDGVTTIGLNVFKGCSGLTSVTIPNSVTSIGYHSFQDCTGLTSVTIPNSVTSIFYEAFSGCTSLTSVSIGNGIQYIDGFAFASCLNLTDVTCKAKNVPYTDSDVFKNSYIEYSTLHVPSASVNAYKTADPWKNFKSIVKIDMPMHKLIYMVDNVIYKEFEIEEGETITPEPAPTKEGYIFSGWSEIPETMPAHDVTVTGSFTVDKYKLTYKVDDAEYKTYDIEYGTTITPEPAPTKEGYTFSGWSDIPETMPANDVTVTGSFSVNKYKLIYKVDNEEYKCYDVEYGSTITAEPAPTKEGYTFSGWSEIPEMMPANDVTVTGTFSVNKYKLIYKVDGEEYKSYDVEYGAKITPEPVPTKEGYTFSGWSEIPETMPANDVTVTGTFTVITVTKYTLTYKVDGEVYKTYELEEGTAITPEPTPTKKGYTFSGWSEIPEMMPANDVTVTGTFSVNKYKLIYKVDGEEYKSYDVEYGATITPEPTPNKEGYTFSGWSDIPQTMPANDVTVTGTFSINSYKLTYMIDDQVYKETVYEYGATITPEPQPEGNYATFEWLDLPEKMPAHDVVVYASYTSGITEVLMTTQRNVRIYSPNGKKLDKMQKGLNIVVSDDGTVKKVVVK